MTDLKNHQYQNFSRQSVLLNIAAIVLAIVLGVWMVQLLPAAIDQAFPAPTSLHLVPADGPSSMASADHFYHPGTHWMTFVGADE